MIIEINRVINPQLLQEQLETLYPALAEINLASNINDGIGIQPLSSNHYLLYIPDWCTEVVLSNVNALIASHDETQYSTRQLLKRKLDSALDGMHNLPAWALATPQEAFNFIEDDILAGMTKAEIEAWVDTNVTTLATAKTALKNIGGELVDLREICQRLALAILYLRDLVLRE